jgi:hypothetical protein
MDELLGPYGALCIHPADLSGHVRVAFTIYHSRFPIYGFHVEFPFKPDNVYDHEN